MYRRSASSLLLVGLLFANSSWLGRFEEFFLGFLGGDGPPRFVHAASDCGASIDPNGQPRVSFWDPGQASCLAASRVGPADPND